MTADEVDYEGKTFVPIFETDSDDQGAQDSVLAFVNIDAIVDPAVGARIRVFRKRHGWSRKRLSQEAGVQLDEVKTAERSPGCTPIGIFSKLCRALRISMHDLAEECIVDIHPAEKGN